ncbi:MAG TPA: Npt1/Npt2 family nucleotide transporter [Myxococcota bacterium]|nr:Npt1/Npt2 family nucleotide transporter [Myxococcota bacterium]
MSRSDVLRVAGLLLLAVLMMSSYEIARPAAESLFVGVHGVEDIPKAWLAVALGVTLTVMVYNRLVRWLRLDRVYGGAALVSVALLAAIQGVRALELPGYAYLFYVWKDVYIVVLVEAFWSISNQLFDLRSARKLYGLFCAAGSIGAILGARLLRWGTGLWGTEDAIWMVAPLLIATSLVAFALGAVTTIPSPKQKEQVDFGVGLSLLRASRYLVLLLLLVLVGQVLMNLLDFQFQDITATAYPDTDERTAAVSKVYEAISYGALALQVTTALVIRLVGVRGVLVGVPALFGAASLALLFSPAFLVAASAKVTSKVLDYSVFRAAKEMLYLPLTYTEKTQGKALIDILTYRLAKGGAALLIQALLALGLAAIVAPMSVLFAVCWGVIALLLVRRYRLLTSEKNSG